MRLFICTARGLIIFFIFCPVSSKLIVFKIIWYSLRIDLIYVIRMLSVTLQMINDPITAYLCLWLWYITLVD